MRPNIDRNSTVFQAIIGFRVARIIPEPSTYVMALCALAGLGFFARRRPK